MCALCVFLQLNDKEVALAHQKRVSLMLALSAEELQKKLHLNSHSVIASSKLSDLSDTSDTFCKFHQSSPSQDINSSIQVAAKMSIDVGFQKETYFRKCKRKTNAGSFQFGMVFGNWSKCQICDMTFLLLLFFVFSKIFIFE